MCRKFVFKIALRNYSFLRFCMMKFECKQITFGAKNVIF